MKHPAFYLILLSTVSLCAGSVHAQDSIDIIRKGVFYGDVRYRYETVDQDGFSQDAHASTLRSRVGFKTGLYHDFQGNIEFDLVGNIGADDYNDSVNGLTQYPLIPDPATEELNQLWISWAGLPDTTIKAGRQVINLDNQRFVGSVGWRQNDQTFDAILIENKSIKDISLQYGYVGRVNRVFGHDHPLGDYDSRTHLAHVSYAASPWLNIAGYGYWMDLDLAPASSSRTFGVRLTGETPITNNWLFAYEAEAATQSDHGKNTGDYDDFYYHLAPSFKHGGITFGLGHESLGGDGTNAFQTPLATLHAFNGWADKFLTTPADGLEDIYGKISYKICDTHPWLDTTTLDLVYHNFSAEDNSRDYGTEWNLQASRTFKLEDKTNPFKEFSVAIKYADYNADDLYTDTQKIWLTVGTKF